MLEEYYVIGEILAKYPDITEDENQLLNEWKKKDGNEAKFDAIVGGETRALDLSRYLQIKQSKESNRDKYLNAVDIYRPAIKTYWWNGWKTYVAAASVIGLLSIIGYKWYESINQANKTETAKLVQQDVKPGQFKAKLTLDDGSVIVLDSAAKGKLTQQGNTHIINNNGQLLYKEEGSPGKAVYNTLTTAKGESYETVLSDGTKIWLNSQSSVRFQVPFTGNERQVEITGEAYFSVAHDTHKPFHVIQNGVDVEVLGTEFNMNSYGDEPDIKTTLLKGRVKMSKGFSTTILLPGQQAIFNKQTEKLDRLDNVNVEEAVAWKNGYFQFEDANLQTILRQVVRWYDVDVEYQGNIPQRQFQGKIPRNSSLSQVLETLENMEALKNNRIHFTMEGKKIIVMPQ